MSEIEKHRKSFCEMMLEKENIDLHEYVEKYDNFLEDHWSKRFEDFIFVTKKEEEKNDKIQHLESELKKRDELLREAVTLINTAHYRTPSENRSKFGATEYSTFFNKPEIKKILDASNFTDRDNR